ncbi:MAG: hypothetical protein ACTS1Z_13290 [Parasphingopyxis sp.]|uniref:hypothetical protein n=1 Tax=Parasphingopyxis sp. TaxID=1920299 RepID=UPI003FA043A4
MRIDHLAIVGAAAVMTLAGCSETEVTRTDSVDTSAADRTPANNPETATDAANDADAVIELIESHIRSSYEGRGATVTGVRIFRTDTGDYAGEAVIADPANGEEVTLECTAAGVEGGAEDIFCLDPRFPE